MARYKVVLDACVIFPPLTRDILMRLSMTGLFKAHWTDKIHDEWMNACIKKFPEINREKLIRVKDFMNLHALDATIKGYEDLESNLNLPDPNDNHVLAAAIKVNADAIITANLKDFPKEQLDQYNIEAIHPDQFIKYQIDLSPTHVYRAIKKMRAGFQNPSFTALELTHALKQNQLPITAELLKDYLDDI